MSNFDHLMRRKSTWGDWSYDATLNVLRITKRFHEYEIDLDEMRSSAQCLNWIFQVASKRWMSPQDRSDLLEAIRDKVHPQARLCSMGVERGKK